MSQSSNSGNKPNQIGRYSSVSSDENNHLINNGTALASFVDDIPFEFNPKYRTIFVPHIDIPEYDTTKIRDILSTSIDFTLENKVLLEALEDLQRKKKEIEADTSRQQSSSPSTTVTTNSVSIAPTTLTENIPFSVTLAPPHLPNSQPTVHLPVTAISFPITPVPLPPTMPSISPSYRLPSVRDIYWPTGNQQNYDVPVSTPSINLTSNILNLPTPIHSTNSSPNSVKQNNNRSFNNCDSIAANDLAATFDGTSDDPFHDAELKSLNDVAELRHLYSAIGSANTVRR